MNPTSGTPKYPIATPVNLLGDRFAYMASVNAGSSITITSRLMMGGSSSFLSSCRVKDQMESLITTFAPEPYEATSPIRVTLVEEDEGFSASYMEANIHAVGDNEFEAFENLRSLILDVFDSLTSEPPENLGPKAKNQLAVLRESIQPA
jgi:hypothetical protein